MSALEDGRDFLKREHPALRLDKAVIATVVNVRAWDASDNRVCMVVDVVTDRNRTYVPGCVLSDRAGFRTRTSRYPRAAANDLRYPVGDARRDLAADLPTRLSQMSTATSSAAWDGDKVLVVMFGWWPIVVGYIENERIEDGIAANQWMDGGAKSLPVDKPLGAPWDSANDELPCVHRPAWPGATVDFDGAVITTRWRDVGTVTEVRDLDGSGNVTTTVLARIEQSRRRIQLLHSLIEVGGAHNSFRFVEGTGVLADVQKLSIKLAGVDALVVDTAIATGMDAPVTLQAALVVIAAQQAQIDELRTMMGKVLVAMNVVGTAGAGAPTAPMLGAVFSPWAPGTGGVLPVGVPSTPAPTDAQKNAMAAANVRVKTS